MTFDPGVANFDILHHCQFALLLTSTGVEIPGPKKASAYLLKQRRSGLEYMWNILLMMMNLCSLPKKVNKTQRHGQWKAKRSKSYIETLSLTNSLCMLPLITICHNLINFLIKVICLLLESS